MYALECHEYSTVSSSSVRSSEKCWPFPFSWKEFIAAKSVFVIPPHNLLLRQRQTCPTVPLLTNWTSLSQHCLTGFLSSLSGWTCFLIWGGCLPPGYQCKHSWLCKQGEREYKCAECDKTSLQPAVGRHGWYRGHMGCNGPQGGLGKSYKRMVKPYFNTFYLNVKLDQYFVLACIWTDKPLFSF